MIDLWITLGIVALVVVLILLSAFNGLSHLRQEVRLAWGHMDEALKTRYDQLAMLLSAVRDSPGAIAAVGEAINAKNRAAVAFSPAQLATAELSLTTAIAAVTTAAANDPAVADDPKFKTAAAQLQASGRLIAQRCREYNEHVHNYNQSIRSFPYLYAAKVFGFDFQPEFQLS